MQGREPLGSLVVEPLALARGGLVRDRATTLLNHLVEPVLNRLALGRVALGHPLERPWPRSLVRAWSPSAA